MKLRFENSSSEKIKEKEEAGETLRIRAPLLESEDISLLAQQRVNLS